MTDWAQLLGSEHQWRKCWQKRLQINVPSLCVSDSPLEDTDPKDLYLFPRSIMAEPDYIEDDNPELIRPQKLVNPVKTSRKHQDLHRELLMNQKRYDSFLSIVFLQECLRWPAFIFIVFTEASRDFLLVCHIKGILLMNIPELSLYKASAGVAATAWVLHCPFPNVCIF